MRIGAKKLGLDVRWRYHFVGPGSLLEPSRDAVLLDVGGRLCPGALDQHQDGTLARSTSELVFRFPELAYGHLMAGWLARRDDGQDLRGRVFEPVLVTHEDPDFDSMVSCWLVQRLIGDGVLPPCAEALVGYSAQVDQGEYAVDSEAPETATHALHMAYLALQNLCSGPDRHAKVLGRGFALLDATLAAIEQQRKHLFGMTVADFLPSALRPESIRAKPEVQAVSAWRGMAEFDDARDLLDGDLAAFQDDWKAATRQTISLPAADGGPSIEVPAFIASRPTRSRLNKYWVRARNYPFFLCPYRRKDAPEPPSDVPEPLFPRVVISLDPTWSRGGRKPTLRGLGFRLEQAEAAARQRRGGDTRGKPPRYADGSCDNADPWYDGRGHSYTIVDSPRAETILPLSQIIDLATGPFWQVRLSHASIHVAMPLEGATPAPWAGSSGEEPGPPECPEQTADAMQAWFEDSREFDTPGSSTPPLVLPRGFVHSRDRIRVFPKDTCPAARLVTFAVGPSAADQEVATLDSLVDWLRDRNRDSRGRIYTVARVLLEPGAASLGDPEGLLASLCIGTGTTSEIRRGDDLVLYNGQAIAMTPRRAAGSDSPAGNPSLLFELMLYVAFQTLTLQSFATRITPLLSGKAVVGGGELRKNFLRFQTRYVHREVVLDGDLRRVHFGLREALGIDAQQAKASDDLDRLEQLERDASDERKEGIDRMTNVLIFVVGLSGVVQAVCSPWDSLAGWQFTTIGVAVPVCLAGYGWLEWTRRKKVCALHESKDSAIR